MLQNVGHDHILTRATLRNRLLLPEERIAPKIVEGAKTPAVSEVNMDRLARGCGRIAFNGRRASRTWNVLVCIPSEGGTMRAWTNNAG